MRIAHISDTHLGFGAYAKLDSVAGINQREVDVYNAFEQAVTRIIELKPDLLIHSGDLFDSVRPQNRAIDFALRQLIRLSEADIETVLISGNHSTPKLRETGSIFRIFEHLKHVHPVHEPGARSIAVGDSVVHAIPHSANPPLSDLIGRAAPSKDSKYNILVLHASVVGAETYKMDEFNEQTVPAEALSNGWDYIALGHYHEHKKIQDSVYYSGSTERLGFGEVNQAKGFLEVDLQKPRAVFHELKIREMMELSSMDAAGLASSEIVEEARRRVSAAVIDDKIVRLAISNVAPEAYRSLDVPSIRKLGSTALHFELKIDRLDSEGRSASEDARIGLLADEFGKYVASLNMPDEKKNKLLSMGMPYLTREEE